MRDKTELLEILRRQLSIEYNCAADAFLSDANAITAPCLHPGRRRYAGSGRPPFFQMVTLGQGAVITADERLHPWLQAYTADKPGHWLFELTHLRALGDRLLRYGWRLHGAYHMFLPDTRLLPVEQAAPVRWFESPSFAVFYGDPRFRNALCASYQPERPDMLAVAAYDGDTVIGMAGCSADTPLLWQIAIDVCPAYRGKGLGAYLVTLLKNEILRRGSIPIYGASAANLRSQNLARRTGFFPAWVEASAERLTEEPV